MSINVNIFLSCYANGFLTIHKTSQQHDYPVHWNDGVIFTEIIEVKKGGAIFCTMCIFLPVHALLKCICLFHIYIFVKSLRLSEKNKGHKAIDVNRSLKCTRG